MDCMIAMRSPLLGPLINGLQVLIPLYLYLYLSFPFYRSLARQTIFVMSTSTVFGLLVYKRKRGQAKL